MTLKKRKPSVSEEIMDDVSSEADNLDSSDDGFDNDVPDLSSFESPSPKKRKSKENGGNAKRLRGEKAPKAAPLTADELIYLKETENLFQSNVFRLQIAELVNETKANEKCVRNFPQWMQTFEHFIQTLEESEETELVDFVNSSEEIRLPIRIPKNVTGKFKFVKPVKAIATGCFVDGTTVGPPFSVEIVLVMPKVIFKKSDKFDQQYLVKRALYLCHFAPYLKNSDLVSPDSKIEFIAWKGDALKPCLTFKANGKGVKSLNIIISAVPAAGAFKLTQFTPDKCNITSVSADDVGSTPHYNSSVCEDLVLQQNEEVKKTVFEANQNMREAAVLMGVWLRQRGMSQGYGGFDMNIVKMYIIHMLRNRRINSSTSSNQIIRTFWLDITGSNDWTSIGPSLWNGSVDDGNPPKDVFHSHHEVVFIDNTGFHNMAFKMRKSTFRRVQKEAEHAISLLNNKDSSCFQALFLKKAPFLHQYDNFIRFQDPKVVSSVVKRHAPKKLKVDHCRHQAHIFSKLVAQVLETGLSNRLESIGIALPDDVRWPLSEKPPPLTVSEIMFGLKFNPDTALSVIDKGPPSNLPEGEEFRQFWGDKCQLRRFKDGSISESIIWADNTLPIRERREIPKQIVCHLMEAKFGLAPVDFQYIGFELNHLNSFRFAPHRTPEESCLAIHKTFTQLSQDLHELKLPLEIVSVHCISESYRFTDPFPPMKSRFMIAEALCNHTDNKLTLKNDANALPPYVPTIDVVVQMSISGKWPEDLSACNRLVAAFYVEIASAFTASQKKYDTHVTPDFVIVRKDAFVFRIYLGYSKQIAILKQRVSDLGVKQYRDTEESAAVEKRFINLPKLSGSMFGLSQRYTSFGATCVMAKRWVSSHQFHDSHFPAVVVELLVAHLYLSSQPLPALMQPLPMFLRFLKSLSPTNFHVEPIIVNFNETLDRNAIADIEKHFTKNRENLPPMFVATPFDVTGVLWTKRAPTLPVLILLAKLAASSLAVLESSLCSGSSSGIMKVFKAPVDLYHFVIKLDPRVVTRRHHRIDFEELLSARNPGTCLLPVFDFDPVALLVQSLEENYHDQALFFYDKYGGSEIGVVLKPQFSAAAPFKVSSFDGRTPVSSNGQTITKPDMVGLAEGFKMLGSGLVVDVTINRAWEP